MNDLDTLRPEVREALVDFDSWMNSFDYHAGISALRWFKVIRADLLALTDRVKDLTREMYATGDAYDAMRTRAEKAEAELAALKARMKPCAQVVGGEVRALMDPDDEGKYVAVLVVEE